MCIKKENKSMSKKEIIEKAIEKVAMTNNTQIIKEHAWSFNPFVERYRYFDKFNREYKGKITKNGIIVKVVPVRIEKKLNLTETLEFIVKGDIIYRITDKKIILEYVREFFYERGYCISFLNEKKGKMLVKGRNVIGFFENQQFGEIEITKRINFWEVKIRDENKEKPYFCAPNFQFILKLKNEIKEGESLLIKYDEEEITSTSLSPFAIIKRAIYGFKSPNLRAFYSEDGLFPEVQHLIRLSVLANFSAAIVNASIFVRIAERLKGNTWYTLASGLLAFVRAPAEIYYMKKSLKLSENLPSTKVQQVLDSEKFKRIIESKEIRTWRNFERELFEILRKKGISNFSNEYGKIKKDIMGYVERNEKEKILSVFEKFHLTDGEKEKISSFIKFLVPISLNDFKKKVMEEVKYLCENKVLKEEAEKAIEDYIDMIFVYNLERFTFNKSYKLLLDRIKQEERTPTNEEITSLINGCKRGILLYRVSDLFLFFSLYAIGYLASFYIELPDFAIPIYYIFNGMAANIIVAALNRYESQISLQVLYRELDSAPTITSAADAWNEYNSHLMRIWAIFSSLGLGLGIGGKLLADKTGNFSRYFVEGIAFFMYVQAFRERLFYYEKLEKRKKRGEE